MNSTLKEEILVIKNLEVRRDNKIVLQNINLNIIAGTFNIIIGPNGGGKTTLLHTILGLIPYEKGEIYIKGENHIDYIKSGKPIGFVPQRFLNKTKFPMTVKDLLSLSIHKEKNKKKEFKYYFNKIKNDLNLNEIIDKPLIRLSHGQQQRAFVGMALMKNPPLLLLDEATSTTDPATSMMIMNLLKNRKEKGKTILMVSHDLSLIPTFIDNAICLKKTLVCHGLPMEALTKEKLKKLYGTELELFLHTDMELKVVKKR